MYKRQVEEAADEVGPLVGAEQMGQAALAVVEVLDGDDGVGGHVWGHYTRRINAKAQSKERRRVSASLAARIGLGETKRSHFLNLRDHLILRRIGTVLAQVAL